ncbi:glutathione S-transferase [Tropicimonas sp. IMCC34043]|uniref:glutathione S-transferase n=1 Tax=Tropicimonas sp. IMCC34043 TaxID=2248760 RepID=UPI000E21F851|nr:glutathione S-transferase [Tropicimonas sp. IMCC34043]
MTYELFIGEPRYSSWSLRGWLLFRRFGIPARMTWVDFLNAKVADQLGNVPPARTVPCLRLPDGTVVWESLAIAEELASRHPDAGIWPTDPAARATARSLAAEMHAGFGALREECQMNIGVAFEKVTPSAAVQADLDRLATIWAHARRVCGGAGPWLCGDYSAADAFFAPVATRIATYGLKVPPEAQAYVEAHLADGAFRRWRAMSVARGVILPWYEKDLPHRPWPGPAPIPARAVAAGPSVNDTCPFSGDPVTDFAEIGGKVIGFCNPFCRDKSVADPEAWPEVAAIYQI